MTLGLVLVLTAGCAPQPEPVESEEPFATEEEAFAAAEETYRNYVDALNAVDLSDPETFEPVYEWTTGDAYASSRESFSQMFADNWSVTGATAFDSFTPIDFTPTGEIERVIADLCLDVTSVDVKNAEGDSVVPETRADRQPVRVSFSAADAATGLKISESTAIDSPICDS
ncbi:hypothetical protein [Microbacterium sp. SLBN-154]|uniref:hypothetical protein n=1 Tax=Microbacterium sp. SLBN-154 TaxID=2768458 RepID=UPI0011547A65|nr:hypothetical protein [Microbacterium sp. SLBN-154]